MDYGDLFEIVLLVAVVLAQLIGRFGKRKQSSEPDSLDDLETSRLSSGSAGVIGRPASLQHGGDDSAAIRAHLLDRIDRVAIDLSELRETTRDLDTELSGLGGPIKILRDVLTGRVLVELAAAADDVAAVRSIAANRPIDEVVEGLETDERVPRAAALAARAHEWLHVIAIMAGMRRDPHLGHLMGDADALAASILDPIARFATARGLSFPRQRPICVPTVEGYGATWFDLLPSDLPVIFVPDDFGEDLMRWRALTHEVGHVVWREVEGFAEETLAIGGFDGIPVLPRISGNRLVGRPEAAFSAWAMEMIADAFATLMLGPAALRGWVSYAASPEHPERVTRAWDVDGRRFEVHPPCHLRTMWTAWLLGRMGYETEKDELLAGWNEMHDHPSTLLIPTRTGTLVELDVDDFYEPGRAFLECWYVTAYECLGGFPVPSIPDVAMGPGLWKRVRGRATQLATDEPFQDDPRVVIAAAIEAHAAHPDRQIRIALGVRRAIRGLGNKEKRLADTHYAQREPTRSGINLDDIRAALALQDVFTPRARTWRR